MDPNTAVGAYGFGSYTPATPGGLAIAPPVTSFGGPTGDNVPGVALPNLPIHWDNPLFWLLILVLIWTGYIFGSFNVGVKKIASIGAKVG